MRGLVRLVEHFLNPALVLKYVDEVCSADELKWSFNGACERLLGLVSVMEGSEGHRCAARLKRF